jgi:hypothetical protein
MFKKAAFTVLALIWVAGIGLAWPDGVGLMVAILAILTIPYLGVYAIIAWLIRTRRGDARS